MKGDAGTQMMRERYGTSWAGLWTVVAALSLCGCFLEDGCKTHNDCGEGAFCPFAGSLCVALPDGTAGRPEMDVGDESLPDGDQGDTDIGDGPCVPDTETCNGSDDDCDGRIDEETGGGPCAVGDEPTCAAAGMIICADGVEECTPATPMSTPEDDCDGRDDDCDGRPDEGTSDILAENQQGVCAGSTIICDMEGNPVQPGEGDIENAEFDDERSCDGLDNDCDGRTDETLELERAAEQRGVCVGALQVCRNGRPQEPTPEDLRAQIPTYTPGVDDSCNGEDNDCDNRVDEDRPPADGITIDGMLRPGVPEACARAVRRCSDDGWINPSLDELPFQAQLAREAGEPWDDFTPREDECDGLDNDCDFETNEDMPVELATNQTGVCFGMTQLCEDGELVDPPIESAPGYEARDESCNGVDNNCDGILDTGANRADVAPPDSRERGVCAEDDAHQICVQLGPENAAYQNRPDGLLPGFQAGDTTCDGVNSDCDEGTDEGYTSESCGPADRRYGGERDPDPPLAEENRSICIRGRTRCEGGRERCDVPLPAAGGAEVCDDGRDNDCDGWTDEGCLGGPCRLDECLAGEGCSNPEPCPDPPARTTPACIEEGANGRCGFGREGGAAPADERGVAGCGCRACSLARLVDGGDFDSLDACLRCEARLNACGGSMGQAGYPGYCISIEANIDDVCLRACNDEDDRSTCRPGWTCRLLQGANTAWEITLVDEQKRPSEKNISTIDPGLKFCLPE